MLAILLINQVDGGISMLMDLQDQTPMVMEWI